MEMTLNQTTTGAAAIGGAPSLPAECEQQLHAEISTSVAPTLDDLNAEFEQQIEKLHEKGKANKKQQASTSTRKTRVMSMRELVANAPKEPLVTLWNGMIVEGSLVDVFGNTGVNKSTIMVQKLTEYCANHKESEVLLVDTELSKRTHARRLYDEDNQRIAPLLDKCDDRFNRVTIGRDCENLVSKLKDIETVIEEKGAVLIVIDNLTFLEPELEKGANAQILMQGIKDMHERLNQKRKTTIICVSHTPKRDASLPLDSDSVGGSKRISNAFDEIIAIGTSVKGDNIRYIKQCKCRDMEITYGERNVLVGRIEKVDGMLQFVTDGTTEPEHVHLQQTRQTDPRKVVAVQKAFADMAAAHPEMGREAITKEVAKQQSISPSCVRKYNKEYDENGYKISKQQQNVCKR